MKRMKRMKRGKTIFDDISEAEKAETRKQWAITEQETERVLQILDYWIEIREQFCKDLETAELAAEPRRLLSDSLDWLGKLKEYRNSIGKHQSWWVLAMLTAAIAAERPMLLSRELGRDTSRATAARKDKVNGRRLWLLLHIKESGLSKEEIEGGRLVRRTVLYPEYYKRFGASMGTLSADLKSWDYNPR